MLVECTVKISFFYGTFGVLNMRKDRAVPIQGVNVLSGLLKHLLPEENFVIIKQRITGQQNLLDAWYFFLALDVYSLGSLSSILTCKMALLNQKITYSFRSCCSKLQKYRLWITGANDYKESHYIRERTALS